MLANKQPDKPFKVPSRGNKVYKRGSSGVNIGVVKGAPFCIGPSVICTPFQNQMFFLFCFVLLDGAVSQLLVELPRNVQVQNMVEFDFQYI